VDASVLTLGYDLSFGARDEMLGALGQFEARMHVPLWAAHETWNNGLSRQPDHPLRTAHQSLDKAMRQFLKTALSQLDEEFSGKNGLVKKPDFERDYRELADRMSQLTSHVGQDRKPERVSETLTPFINRFVLRSALAPVIDRAIKEGPFRHAHGIPPGNADIRKAKSDSSNTASRETNQFGDLIIWLEILGHASTLEATEILFLTKDVAKDDWVYRPRRVKDDVGRPVANTTLTLPRPLLVAEAATVCSMLQRLHIVTLDEFVRVLATNLSQALPQLSIALQPETEEFLPRSVKDAARPIEESRTPGATNPTHVESLPELTFRAGDLMYDPVEGDFLDELTSVISASDWRGQNKAVRELHQQDLLSASKLQKIRLGRVLASAVNGLAIDPLKFLSELLLSRRDPAVSREVFLGVLAEVYLTDDGAPKRPTAASSLTELVFNCARDGLMEESTAQIVERLDNQRRNYLALPDETPRRIRLEATFDRSASLSSLISLQADGVELLGQAIHRSQRFSAAGFGTALVSEGIVETVAAHFVVPIAFLEMEGIATKFSIPDQIGFIPWGPGSGLPLRQLS